MITPVRRGIRTLLIAEYASMTSFPGATPGTGRCRVVTTVRSASAGTEASTEFSVDSFDNFSIKGGRTAPGSFKTNGARLESYVRSSEQIFKNY